MNYEEFKAEREVLTTAVDVSSEALQLFGFVAGYAGMTPYSVRSTLEFKAAKRAFNLAFSELRSFNANYVKRFKKEMRKDRIASRNHKYNETGIKK